MGNQISIRVSKVKIESDCESECCISFRKKKTKPPEALQVVQDVVELIQVPSSPDSE